MKQKTLNQKIIKSDVGLPTNYCTISLSKKKIVFSQWISKYMIKKIYFV